MYIKRVQNWDEVRGIIRECFKGDDDLINKYHIKGGSLEECVEDTFNVLKNFTYSDFEFYELAEEGVVGFLGIEPNSNYLTTFCLKKEFRSKDNRDEMWDIILEFFKEFKCGLYEKNKRAINFLVGRGCEVEERSKYNDHDIVILKYKKEESCH